ncbi:MAG: hypothetical protein ACRCXB_26425 [Aeromonadaceae bacterium]
MKISNSKKELARIISENGGWRDGAKWSIQDSDKNVEFMTSRPEYMKSSGAWYAHASRIEAFKLDKLLPNWHQTILSREEYFHLYPAPDADGWIERSGGECPVDEGVIVDLKWSDGFELKAANPRAFRWQHLDSHANIIAYRLHKPEKQLGELCDKVTEENKHGHVDAKPTIEQLASDYRNSKDYADRKQEEADAAKADAEAKLAELVAAGKAIGLVLSVAATEPELVITDWRDLRVGDHIWVGDSGDDNNCPEGEYDIADIDDGDGNHPLGVMWRGGVQWPQIHNRGWRFISRP